MVYYTIKSSTVKTENNIYYDQLVHFCVFCLTFVWQFCHFHLLTAC